MLFQKNNILWCREVLLCVSLLRHCVAVVSQFAHLWLLQKHLRTLHVSKKLHNNTGFEEANWHESLDEASWNVLSVVSPSAKHTLSRCFPVSLCTFLTPFPFIAAAIVTPSLIARLLS